MNAAEALKIVIPSYGKVTIFENVPANISVNIDL
jgi:hypothetical protein